MGEEHREVEMQGLIEGREINIWSWVVNWPNRN